MNYYPDRWLVLKLNHNNQTFYRVFGVWVGGYTQGDSWRMSSGITSVVESDIGYEFKNESGSSYFCSKRSYGTSAYGQGILNHLISTSSSVCLTIEVVPEDTNFIEVEYK